MKTTQSISVAVPRPVYNTTRLLVRVLLAVASALALGIVGDLAGISSPASSRPVLDFLHEHTALAILSTGIFLVLAIVAVVILRAPEPPPSGDGTRLLVSVAMSGVPGVLLVGVLLVILLRPAWCPSLFCPAPLLVTNPHGVHDQSLELYFTALQSSIFEIPGDPAQYTLGNLPEQIGALRVDQPAQPPYRIVLGIHSLQQGRFGLIVERVALMVVATPVTPQPFDVWVVGSPLNYGSNPFEVTYRGQYPGTLLTAIYVLQPQGHVQLAPGESDELDLQILSQVPVDLVFQVQVTYRVADQSNLHILTLPTRFEAVFASGSNWHVYRFQNGKFVVSH